MKISIIIPIFNADAFLDQCISSVLDQTFDDFELILINDGSTDQSGEICEKFAASDSRIKLYHKENGGVSSARNLGIENSIGEWITFVDSDDYLTSDYLKAFSEFVETDTDLIIQGQNSIEKKHDEIMISYNFENQCLIAPNEFLNRFNILPFYFGVWCKAFKTKIIKDNKIIFDTAKSLGEDTLFNLKYLSYCKSDITLLDRNEYVYRNVEGSLTKQILSYKQRKELFIDLKKHLVKLSNKIENYHFYAAELFRALYTDKTVDNTQKELSNLMKKHKNELLTAWTDPGIASKLILFLLKANQIFLVDLILKRIYS
mgnify:CR=1 FL=1